MISVSTSSLKEALSKVSKCASNDKAAPLTQLVRIHTQNEKTLAFTATDERNIFTYSLVDELASFDSIDVCVLIVQLNKLVSKFNSAKTELFVSDTGNELKITGDGTYTISIPVDSGGIPIKYPKVDVSNIDSETYTGRVSDIVNSSKYCEGSITKLTYDIQVEDYPRTNYYLYDKMVTLDGFLATVVDGLDFPFATLISPATMKLLSNFTDEGFSVYKSGKYVVFKSTNCELISIEPEGINAFPHEVAISLIDGIDGYTVDVSSSVIVNALNRLSLFTDETYENSIMLKFNKDGVFAYTINESCCEQLSAEPQDDEYTCYVNVDSLISQLKPYGSEVVTLYYGNEQCLKIVCDNVSQIVVLSDLGSDN